MRNQHNLTPREAALMAAIQALFEEWRSYQKGHQDFNGTVTFNHQALHQLAKIHNRLLNESGFDGNLLPDGSKE